MEIGVLKISRNEEAPHSTIVTLSCQTFEKMASGELSGDSVSTERLTFDIVGKNKQDCIDKTKRFMEIVKNGRSNCS